MDKNKFKNTKTKLTISFVLIVFFIALFLWIIFFTSKYFHLASIEKKDFSFISYSLEKKFNSLEDYISFSTFSKKNFDNSYPVIKNPPKKPIDENQANTKLINYFILDLEENRVIYSNLLNIPNENVLEDILLSKDYNLVFKKKWIIYKKIYFEEKGRYYDIVFLKELWYNIEEYLEDIFWFLLILLLFSILFYVIWLNFVNKNLRPVEESLNSMKDFIHNAWHELKTPISVINSNLLLIKETKKYEKELIVESIDEINRLDKLIESLINLSDINSSFEVENLDLKKEIDFIIREFNLEISSKNIKLDTNLAEKVYKKVNREHFYIFFSNLLSNAIKYNRDSWTIHISLNKKSLLIKDEWSWISKENVDKIFDRFFKEDKSRNSIWYGIGLSLVKKISDIYKRKISVKETTKDWTSFEVLF